MRPRLPRTGRAIPRKSSRRQRFCIVIASLPRSTAIRQIGLFPKLSRMAIAREVDFPKISQQAVTYARDHVFERSAVQDERTILQSAMDRSMGQASASQVRAEFDRRATQGEFRTVAGAPGAAGEQYTTAAMLRMEKETVARMQEGNRQDRFALSEAHVSERRL